MGEAEAEAYLKKEIHGACSHLGFFASVCEAELDKQVDKLVQEILKHNTPRGACHAVDLCSEH